MTIQDCRRALCLLLTSFLTLPMLTAAAGAELLAALDADEPAAECVYAIYNDAECKALSAEADGNRLKGTAALPDAEGRMSGAGLAAFTLEETADGVRFLCDGKYLTSGATGNSLTLETTPGAYSLWTIEDAGNGLVYLKNNAASYRGSAQYLEYYGAFTAYTKYASSKPGPYAMSLRPIADAPEEPAAYALATELAEGDQVILYAPGAQAALSSGKSGYNLKGVAMTPEDGVLRANEASVVGTVRASAGGYTFTQGAHAALSCDSSGSYVNISTDPSRETMWILEDGNVRERCFRLYSAGLESAKENGHVYLEWYAAKGGFTVYDYVSPGSNDAYQFQIYKKGAEPEAPGDFPYGDVLEPGQSLVIWNRHSQAVLGMPTADSQGVSFGFAPGEQADDGLVCGTGAYVFTVGKSPEGYYTFQTQGAYLTSDDRENLFLQPELTEYAQWYLEPNPSGDWFLFNRRARYYQTPVCVECVGKYLSGWTFGAKSEPEQFAMAFCTLSGSVEVIGGVTDSVTDAFHGGDAVAGRDYSFRLTLNTVTPEGDIRLDSLLCNGEALTVDAVHGKEYAVTVPAALVSGETLALHWQFSLGESRIVQGARDVWINNGAHFDALSPARDSRTGTERRPAISLRIESAEELGVFSYTPDEDLPLGRTIVAVRAGRVPASAHYGREEHVSWSFVVGDDPAQLYFGQLHSHTGEYSDGVGTLAAALDYIAALPESDNVDFAAFTDHSNYFDSASAANPEDAIYDPAQMTEASRAKWQRYLSAVAEFNAAHPDILALAGFEMSWAGGPGHINTFGTPGVVSRNNQTLNDKTDDAGLLAYYALLDRPEGANTISQFNHPGKTYGNFADFNYRDELTDSRIYLLEVGNGDGIVGQSGYFPSYEEYTRALDMGWHLAPTNNQDNHRGRWGNANDARDVILADAFSEEGLYEAIRAYRVYATEDKNLSLFYTVNGEPMGTVFTQSPETLDVRVQFSDPDPEDHVWKLELIADGGRTAYAWDDLNDAAEMHTGCVSVTLPSMYRYYYLRVTQADGDVAVTAPVWVHRDFDIGIATVTPAVATDVTLETAFFNNETAPATVKSLIYTVNGGPVLGTDDGEYILPPGQTRTVPFTFSPTEARRLRITVQATVEYEGLEYSLSHEVTVDIEDPQDDAVRPVAQVRAMGWDGARAAVEGVVTSASVFYDRERAFYYGVFVQDETGGIFLSPADERLKPGDRVRAVGYTRVFEGELGLETVELTLLDSGPAPDPLPVTAARVSDGSTAGPLVTLSGTVTQFTSAGGLVQTIDVEDHEGNSVQVFVDENITPDTPIQLNVGDAVTVTGLVSLYDRVAAPWRIRVRDRAEVRITPPPISYDSEAAPAAPVVTPASETQNAAESFADVSADDWYYEAVDWAVNKGLMKGVGEHTFDPGGVCTRAMAVTMLWRMAGEPEAGAAGFHDLEADAWYAPAVNWAAVSGVVLGTSADTFSPDTPITREQLAVILYRYAQAQGLGFQGVWAFRLDFADAGEVSDYAYEAMCWMTMHGVIKGMGDGTAAPRAEAARAQIAAMFMRFSVETGT